MIEHTETCERCTLEPATRELRYLHPVTTLCAVDQVCLDCYHAGMEHARVLEDAAHRDLKAMGLDDILSDSDLP